VQLTTTLVYGVGVTMTNQDISYFCKVGNNRLGTDPLFVNAANAPYDFHLQPSSPAIETGAFAAEVKTDFDGWRRQQGAALDVGAYLFTPTGPRSSPAGAASDRARLARSIKGRTSLQWIPKQYFDKLSMVLSPTITDSVFLSQLAELATAAEANGRDEVYDVLSTMNIGFTVQHGVPLSNLHTDNQHRSAANE
jgi:hypothetical protein